MSWSENGWIRLLNDSFGAVKVGQNPTTAVTFFDPRRRNGYAEQFNLTIQRQIGKSSMVEVSAIGNEGRKLPNANLSLDQIAPSVLGPGRSTQAYRPFPQFSNVTLLAPTIATSN
jgi:hypothetical protein